MIDIGLIIREFKNRERFNAGAACGNNGCFRIDYSELGECGGLAGH